MDPVYFASPEEFRAWLEANHSVESALVVGFYKVGSGIPSITWAEAVDQALCVGWIDGVTRRIDNERYTIRFTPRKPGSIWSKRNIERIEVLRREGRLRPAGEEAFEKRREDRSGIYSFEQDNPLEFPDEFTAQLTAHPDAETFFATQAPWYRRAATHWVMSAKREATRQKRMTQLVEDSAAGRTIKPLTRK
ncbi:MAG: bacteriocin-protection protein [Sphaerobacteraceae bacterium]|nr:MAG: bacteriocin-protection protein [Sphaerobacteraceae bacterium]